MNFYASYKEEGCVPLPVVVTFMSHQESLLSLERWAMWCYILLILKIGRVRVGKGEAVGVITDIYLLFVLNCLKAMDGILPVSVKFTQSLDI